MKKEIRTWLLVNVKTGNCRCVKKLRATNSAYEIPVQIKLDVIDPEQPVMKAEGTLTLSKPQLTGMMLEELEDKGEDEDE